tara:strand:+ start:1673 stop:1807 length:135 start_codon:yes stop_codon:yes gene_type:complete
VVEEGSDELVAELAGIPAVVRELWEVRGIRSLVRVKEEGVVHRI